MILTSSQPAPLRSQCKEMGWKVSLSGQHTQSSAQINCLKRFYREFEMSAVSSVVQVSGPAPPVIGQYVKVQN